MTEIAEIVIMGSLMMFWSVASIAAVIIVIKALIEALKK